jgi:hypothetical protein
MVNPIRIRMLLDDWTVGLEEFSRIVGDFEWADERTDVMFGSVIVG